MEITIPTRQVFCAVLVQMGELINITVLFPFLIFLVEDFGISGSQVGVYAGLLAASFCSAQFCSSYMWGKISDSYGRKPAILAGLMGTAIGMLIFGFSQSYEQAIIGRLLPGLLSGNGGVMKSFLTESTNDSNRSKAFSYLSFGVSVGAIVGPLIGGYLSFAGDKYPGVFGNPFFSTFPALLPALCCVMISLITAVICALWMKETLEPNPSTQSHKENTEKSLELAGPVNSPFHEVDITTGVDSRGVYDYVGCEEQNDFAINLSASQPVEIVEEYSIWSDKVVLHTTSTYGLLCLAYILMDETIPFLLRSEIRDGGFDLSSSDIGFVLSVGGLPMLIFVLFFLAKVVSGSKLRMFRIFNALSMVATLIWPLLGIVYNRQLQHGHTGQFIITACLILAAAVKHIISTICFTSVIVMVNHSVESKHLGSANGLGQALASAARALGPLLGGVGWSLGVSTGLVYLNFVIIVAVLLMGEWISLSIPLTIDTKKESKKNALAAAATKDGDVENFI
jgi:MFS family permease